MLNSSDLSGRDARLTLRPLLPRRAGSGSDDLDRLRAADFLDRTGFGLRFDGGCPSVRRLLRFGLSLSLRLLASRALLLNPGRGRAQHRADHEARKRVGRQSALKDLAILVVRHDVLCHQVLPAARHKLLRRLFAAFARSAHQELHQPAASRLVDPTQHARNLPAKRDTLKEADRRILQRRLEGDLGIARLAQSVVVARTELARGAKAASDHPGTKRRLRASDKGGTAEERRRSTSFGDRLP